MTREGLLVAKTKKEIKYFSTIKQVYQNKRHALEIFSRLAKSNKITIKDFKEDETTLKYLFSCQNRKLINEIQGSANTFEFNKNFNPVLGIGISNNSYYFTLMNLAGEILFEKKINLELASGKKIKNKDLEEHLNKKLEGVLNSLQHNNYADIIGLSVDENFIDSKVSFITAKLLKKILNKNVMIIKNSASSGYAEKFFNTNLKEKNILYIHSDEGNGVLFKDGLVFESVETQDDKGYQYLTGWHHFNIVENIKELISRGIGSDIVSLIGGNIENISLDTVFEAANKNDKLALDIIKRTAVALSVRITCLVHMFETMDVVLGGGIEKIKKYFLENLQSTVKIFMPKKEWADFKVYDVFLGETAPSKGAALLCVRELFMEV
ncbi:transcriptional repressor [Candidatus Omnitrophus magneticus]|uniref:Transcriptional repressor n=1 Tax=Candidatus Omnitrophus magneticus TaxID=1609969 RepID=A0A0F0CN62_9BACT|nr:transcriptional repressor [Candidatus Omnitrophus magneticus]